jgi:hypothetical protein
MEISLNTEAVIWKRILETTDIEELETLLKLVVKDEEARMIILNKVKNYEEVSDNRVEINLTINTCNK